MPQYFEPDFPKPEASQPPPPPPPLPGEAEEQLLESSVQPPPKPPPAMDVRLPSAPEDLPPESRAEALETARRRVEVLKDTVAPYIKSIYEPYEQAIKAKTVSDTSAFKEAELKAQNREVWDSLQSWNPRDYSPLTPDQTQFRVGPRPELSTTEEKVLSRGGEKMGVAEKAREIGLHTADLFVPGVWARHWDNMTPTDRAINIGLDVIALAPIIGWGIKAGAKPAIKSIVKSLTSEAVKTAESKAFEKQFGKTLAKLDTGLRRADAGFIEMSGKEMKELAQEMASKGGSTDGSKALLNRGAFFENNADEIADLVQASKDRPLSPIEKKLLKEELKQHQETVTKFGETIDKTADLGRGTVTTDMPERPRKGTGEPPLKPMPEVEGGGGTATKELTERRPVSTMTREQAARELGTKEPVVARGIPLPEPEEKGKEKPVPARPIEPEETPEPETPEIPRRFPTPERQPLPATPAKPEPSKAPAPAEEPSKAPRPADEPYKAPGKKPEPGPTPKVTPKPSPAPKPSPTPKTSPTPKPTPTPKPAPKPQPKLAPKPQPTPRPIPRPIPTPLVRKPKPKPRLFPKGRSDKEKRKALKEAKGIVARRRGSLGGKDVWRVKVYPYGPEDTIVLLGKPPEGVRRVVGVGSVAKSAVILRGKVPSRVVFDDTGAVDDVLYISGKRVRVTSVRDVAVTPKSPISQRAPRISGRGIRISPRTPRLR